MTNKQITHGGIKCLAILISIQFCTTVWSAAVPLATASKSAHSQLLMDVVRLLSSSTATKAAAREAVDKTELRCPLKEATMCFNEALGKFYKSVLNDDMIDVKLSICSLANDLDTCNIPVQQPECLVRETLTFDAITKGSRYFCTLQGYNNYLGLMPCLSHAHVVRQLKGCRQKLALSARDVDDCKLFDVYVNCAAEATETSCATDIKDILKESLAVVLQPYREAICPVNPPVAQSTTGTPDTHRKSVVSRSRREAEDFGSFFGGSAFDGLAGAFSPTDLFGGEIPALTDFTMPGFSSGEAGAAQESAAPGLSWGQMVGEQSLFSNQEFPWDLLQRLTQQFSGQGAGSSEEISTMATDTATQEANSEEVTVGPLELTTPEISSEEVNTAVPDTTPQAESSEEATTGSPDTTPQGESSEEVTTGSPDTTPQGESSEEVTTSSPDTTPQADSSEEVSTGSPDTTPQAESSEEVSTGSPDTTPQAESSEEISTPSSDTTPQAESSEEVTTGSPDTTPQADSSEEISTSSPDTINTTESNSEEVSSLQPEITTTTTSPTTPEPEIAPQEPETEATTTVQTPVPTTKNPSVAPFHCYECHSGTAGYWLNPMCPPNGKIHGWAALPVACDGPCISVVTKFPKGEVYRACSTNYYFPFRAPYDGCIRHNQELYCFCSGDLCNNRDMLADQQAYILKGLITKY